MIAERAILCPESSHRLQHAGRSKAIGLGLQGKPMCSGMLVSRRTDNYTEPPSED